VKLLILAAFAPLGTIHGMTEGLAANGHTWESFCIAKDHPNLKRGLRKSLAKRVVQKFQDGNFDTVFIGKGSTLPVDYLREITERADTTYWCPDSVSGGGCGPVDRPEDVGIRGLQCARIICTGTEGARWWRTNGYKGRIAQIYQGCRHRIWRPENLDVARKNTNTLCFLGSENYKGAGGRSEKLRALTKGGFKLYRSKRIFHADAAKVYYNSAICLNLVCGTPGEGPDPTGITSNRLVRLLTAGGFVLTERNTDITASFEDENQLAMFDHGNAEQLLHRSKYYLDHTKERLEIARRGWEWSKNWGWDKQMEKMVRFIEGEDVPADGAAARYVGTWKG